MLAHSQAAAKIHSRSIRMTCGFSAIWPSATMAASASRTVLRSSHRSSAPQEPHRRRARRPDGAGRCFPAKCRFPPCARRWPPARRCGCAPPAGYNSRPRGVAAAICPPAPDRATGRPKGAERMPRAMSAMSATTAEAVAMPPAPGPTRVSSLTASASTVTALVTPMTCAIAEDWGTMVGCTRCSTPCGVRWATPSSFTR